MRELTPERRASITLSHLTEPSDITAGRLVAERGVVQTLNLIHEVAIPSDSDVGNFIQRTAPRLRGFDIDELVAEAERRGITILTPEDEEWPTAQLAGLGFGQPHALYVKGNPAALTFELPYSVSIVGARAATSYGEHITNELAADLAKDHVIVSGLAYGIDAAAHRATLAAGGRTIAVLAGGVDRVYPTGHADLFRRTVETGGAAIAEVPIGSAPTKWRFLQRNRLIAALGTASIVVEAGWRSGSLNEAAHALGLGRPVGAVPGPVTSAASAGCHRLIQEYGVNLVTSATDVRQLTGATA